jgi:hypothetical protein
MVGDSASGDFIAVTVATCCRGGRTGRRCVTLGAVPDDQSGRPFPGGIDQELTSAANVTTRRAAGTRGTSHAGVSSEPAFCGSPLQMDDPDRSRAVDHEKAEAEAQAALDFKARERKSMSATRARRAGSRSASRRHPPGRTCPGR